MEEIHESTWVKIEELNSTQDNVLINFHGIREELKQHNQHDGDTHRR